jgi:outer membrane biosynthesis protein TonB
MALVLTTPPMPEAELIDPPRGITEISLVPPPPPPVPVVAKTETAAQPTKRASSRSAEPRRKRDLDRQLAESSGILPALAAMDRQLAAGLDAALRSAGNLIGTGGAQPGAGPWFAGRGPIGGGGSIDEIGDVGTKGGPGYGSEGGDFGDKEERTIRMSSDPIVIGALGKAEIDAVIKRHLSSIRYCYERQLSRAPDLSGKVSIKFVISKSGAVSRAVIDSSTVDDAALESCLQSRFLQMQFSEPKGGGIVIVNYPFLFAPG